MSRLEIIQQSCDLCGLCVEECPFDALAIVEGWLRVGEGCVLCGVCVEKCPADALCIVEEREREERDLGSFSGVWVLAEQSAGRIHPVTFQLLGKGRELADRRGTCLCAVLVGDDLGAAAKALCCFPVEKIFVAQHPSLARFRSGTYAAALAELIERERPEIVLCGATSMGRAFLPRVAALVKTGLTADCTGLEIADEEGLLLQTRPAFGGNIMATIVCPRHRPQMATVRPNVLPTLEPGRLRDVEMVRFTPSGGAIESAVEVLEVCEKQTDAVNIAEADVVVSGGRGVSSAQGFGLIRELAQELGGAVGASRAAVDAGWIPYPHQVGQTGKTLQPKLYVACGISGAVQHLVGMQSAGKIIAINQDPEAPIFRVADVGLVGDLHVIVPRWIERIRRRRAADGPNNSAGASAPPPGHGEGRS